MEYGHSGGAEHGSHASGNRPIVYIHVGAPKTGTTFLQEILWANRDRLADEGVLLPGRQVEHFHATLGVREISLDRHPGAAPDAWEQLAAQALAWDGRAIISHELFAGASEEQARRALEALQGAEVHVIYTARDLARQIPAEWQEHVKHRVKAPMGEFVAEVQAEGRLAEWFWRVQDPAGVIRRWGSALPPERVHLITVPPANAEPGLLWQRFTSLTGIDPDGYDTTTARSNVSLGAAEVELVRKVNQALGDRFTRPGVYPRLVKEKLSHEVLARREGKIKFGLSAELKPWLEHRSERILDEITATGCDVIGDLAELRPGDQESPGLYPEHIEDRLVADAAAETVVALLGRWDYQRERADTATRRATEEGARAAALEAEVSALREKVGKRWHRPVKQVLIDLSERHRWLWYVRVAYWRTVNAMRRVRQRLTERGEAPR